ncbi:MAG: recombinase zinc beta ribbon domain-containing protein [Abitibacteriaceae bacterium]|nr:recombinase zinc beta ribbon domain-containing protein [Abditibacteriaceae bacterium]
MANQYILDLKKAVTRGLNSKVDKGWYPHKAPEGYKNVDTIIEADAERFPLIRKAWELMLTGHYTPPQVLQIMTDEWGYTTKRLKRRGGTPFTRTSIYGLFSNIFYTGYFKRNGEIFQGQHPAMVTMEEFFRVQALLRRRHQVRRRVHEFAYNGLMECGHCGCAIVGDRKQRRLLNGQHKTYTYYVCSNSKRTCTRRGMTEAEVDRQILNLLHKISIPPELRELGQAVIREWKERETGVQQEVQLSLGREIEQAERKRDKLLDLKLNDLLNDSEYLEQKTKLTETLSRLRVDQQLAQEQAQNLSDNLENTLTLATYGSAFFESGEPAIRALIAKTLGTRYVLTNKSLAIEISPVFSPFCELSVRETQNAAEFGSESTNGGVAHPIRQLWWDTLDCTRTGIFQVKATIPGLEDLERARLHWAARPYVRRAGPFRSGRGTGIGVSTAPTPARRKARSHKGRV